MLAPRGEDFVHKRLRPQRQAIGKIAHPTAQHLPVGEPTFRRQHRVHFLRLEPAPQSISLLVQSGGLALAKEQQPILGQDHFRRHGRTTHRPGHEVNGFTTKRNCEWS